MEKSDSAFSFIFIELLVALFLLVLATYFSTNEGISIWMYIIIFIGSIGLGIKLGFHNCFLGRAFGVGYTFGLLASIVITFFINSWNLGINIGYIYVLSFLFLSLIPGLITFTANAITKNIVNKNNYN